MIETECPYCGTEYRLRSELAGQVVRCRACQESFEIPAIDEDADLEELHSVESSPVDLSRKRFTPSASAHRGHSEIDSHGFLVNDVDEETQDQPEEDDDDEDAHMMQEAAQRGAAYLYEPRVIPSHLVLPNRREIGGSPIPKEILWGFLFLLVGGGAAFLAIHYASNIRANLALNGLPVEIQSEFEQNDPSIGSPAPESVKIFKTLTVRDTSKHKELIRKMTGTINQAADIMARIQDQDSAQSAQDELQGFQNKIAEYQAEAGKLFNPNPKEDREIGRAVGGELVKAVDRMAIQARRIASFSNDPFARMRLGTMERGIASLKRKYGNDVESADNPDAYVEVRVAGLKNTAEREYIGELLTEMASPKNKRGATSSMAATRYALWPVSSPSVFAKKITFGKVIHRTGKEIWVVADPIDPEIMKERAARLREEGDRVRAEQAKNQAETKAAQDAATAAAEANKPAVPVEPEIPDDADEITRAQIILAKSPNFFKRRDAAQVLLKADLSGREDQVLEGLRSVLNEENPFILNDTLAIFRLCKSPLRVQILADNLNIERNRDAIINALGETGDPAAIEPLVNVMRIDSRSSADRSLIKFGVAAEPAVIPLLASGDAEIRRRACNILGEIGTDEALKAFKKLPADLDLGVRGAAKNAMRAIENRTRLSTKSEKSENSKK